MEPSTLAQQNAERAMESANLGLSWAREFAEQALNQSKVAMDGLLKASNKMAKDFESQSSAIREHTTTLTEKALSNSVDFGRKCLRAKEPDELVKLQTEFISQQAQIFAEQTKELGQKIQNATQAAYNTLADTARKTEQSITRADQSLKRQRSEPRIVISKEKGQVRSLPGPIFLIRTLTPRIDHGQNVRFGEECHHSL